MSIIAAAFVSQSCQKQNDRRHLLVGAASGSASMSAPRIDRVLASISHDLCKSRAATRHAPHARGLEEDGQNIE